MWPLSQAIVQAVISSISNSLTRLFVIILMPNNNNINNDDNNNNYPDIVPKEAWLFLGTGLDDDDGDVCCSYTKLQLNICIVVVNI